MPGGADQARNLLKCIKIHLMFAREAQAFHNKSSFMQATLAALFQLIQTATSSRATRAVSGSGWRRRPATRPE